MTSLLERFFGASRAKWWQLLAAVIIGALFGLIGVSKSDGKMPNPAPYAISGATIGLFVGLFLLWVDAGRERRERQGDRRPKLREWVLNGCMIIGFTIAVISMLSAAFMGVVHVMRYFRQ